MSAIGLYALAACTGGGTVPEPGPTAAAVSDEAPTARSQTIEVVTTLYPFEYFTRRIAGRSANVVNLISPGVEAHDFEPSPADIRQLGAAHVVIYSGSGFEPWLDRALDSVGRDGRTIVDASSGLADRAIRDGPGDEPAVDGGPGRTVDPHVWLDPLKALEQVRLIRDGLGQAYPDGLEAYAENASLLEKELTELHARFLAGLGKCRVTQFVTSHNAFGYLAWRYGLKQVPVSGASPEAEPSPRDLAAITDNVRKLKVKYLLVEPIASSRLAETVAGEVGAGLLPLHPLESLTIGQQERGETYFTLMNVNLRNLQTAMECED